MYAPTPDGEVQIFTSIPLDKEYNHTFYFLNESAQSAYFSSIGSTSYNNMMYIRQSGRLRAPVNSDALVGCNYLRYRNSQYLNKWFYAFINEIYYINDNCCEISFEIDVIQSYFFGCYVPDCWIERTHTRTDVIGENRVAENVDIGGYEIEDSFQIPQLGLEWSVIMFSTFDPNTWTGSGGSLNNGMYTALARTEIGKIQLTRTASGTTTAAWLQDPRPVIKNIIDNHADLVEGIVAIIIAPSYFETQSLLPVQVQRPSTFMGYTPHNKKLFTSPFLTLYITESGSGKMYEFEEFGDGGGGLTGTARFGVFSDNAPAQSVILAPYNYRGTGANDLNYSEMMIESSFPQCAWASDAFKTYLAQNQTNIGLSAALGAAQVVGGVATIVATEGAGAALGAGMVASGLGAIAGQVADLTDKSKRAPTSHGNITGTALYAAGEKTFRFYTLRPRDEYLKIIDAFFDKFGYAIKSIGTPDFNARPHWTYIKTSDAIVKSIGNVAGNAIARQKIAKILDKGITFWNTPAELGDYSLDNSV